MKKPEEWDKEGICVASVARRIQQDAQPKWVTGEVARQWPDGIWILVRLRNNPEPFIIPKSDAIGDDRFGNSECFLCLDDILKQDWPK